ncbi:hypothetical protein MPTK1_2g01700 [Marchantia polymorpha subsp. ruderalis]|uniref:HMA domain-containing protein n=1 Tax=Marchantia polymorpha TaxID=3197 RepID=A0A2R6VY84_MARPO|nr:hypothetical protein MARPO_0983s0001 [Marchantia polymorpha]BBN00741.1 hypothetical protein Mp_2g01700 [Marchantia polymorpha subsp. ruderalis]|eukprot:PTQ26562.1 hypothetical protein MARPO_0983s0001 [Marchantia polymorpha]
MAISRSAGRNMPSFLFSGHARVWNVSPNALSDTGRQAEKKTQESATRDEKNGVIELRVPLCCEDCVEKIHRKMKGMDGVDCVECDQEKQKVVVRGDAKPQEVLRRVKQVLNRSQFWTERIV